MTRRRVRFRMTCGAVMVLALTGMVSAQATQSVETSNARGVGEYRPIVRGRDSDGASTPVNRNESSPAFDATKVAASLGIVLVLILALKWSAKRMFPGQIGLRSSRAVEVLSRSPLSPRQQFLLLRVGKRLVVVADSGGSMNPICQITDADEVAEMLGQLHSTGSHGSGKNFLALFRGNRQTFDEKAAGEEIADSSDGEDAEVGATREEIGGLMEKIRVLSKQFRK